MSDTTSAHTYIFAVPGVKMLKVGYTSKLASRRYQLRWGEMPDYIPTSVKDGDYVCIVTFETAEIARRVERRCQRYLAKYRYNRPDRPRRAGGRSEWFCVSLDTAVYLLLLAARQEGCEHKITDLHDTPMFFLE